MAKISKQQNSFLYDDQTGQKKNLNKATAVQPTMLPPLFREKSRLLQKFYVFLLIIALSIATGVTSFVMLDDFSTKYGIHSGTQIAFLIISLIMWFIIIGASIIYVWWSRTRSQLMTLTGAICSALPALVLAAVLLYLDFSPTDNLAVDTIDKAFFILGASAIGVAAGVGLVVLVRNLFSSKLYRDAKFRSLYTVLGLIVTGLSPMVLWMTAKETHFGTFDISSFIYGFVALFGGAILFTIGIMLSMKYKFSEAKSTTSSIRISGSLPTVIVFVTLLTIAIRFLGIVKFELPLIITISADVIFIALFGLYLFFKARIKNIGHTNPLFNEFMMKSFIIIITTVGLIMVAMLPNLVVVKNYAPLAFGILGMTSLAVVILVLLAHFTNLIVFEKFIKSIVLSASITILLILMLVFVLGSLSQSSIIMQIVSRSIVLILMILAIIGEIILLLLDITAIHKDIVSTARFIKRKNKNAKGIKKKNKKQDINNEIEVEESIA